MRMTKHLVFVITLIALVACRQNESQGETSSQSLSKEELSKELDYFDKATVISLYDKLNSKFDIDFNQHHLESALIGISINRVKAGEEFEEEMLFEDFECNCFDIIRISYSNENQRFLLWVYEEFYESELDWCPESSYTYSFQIRNRQIVDLQLDFMAG